MSNFVRGELRPVEQLYLSLQTRQSFVLLKRNVLIGGTDWRLIILPWQSRACRSKYSSTSFSRRSSISFRVFHTNRGGSLCSFSLELLCRSLRKALDLQLERLSMLLWVFSLFFFFAEVKMSFDFTEWLRCWSSTYGAFLRSCDLRIWLRSWYSRADECSHEAFVHPRRNRYTRANSLRT